MQITSIEWVRNPDGTVGYTWNPITGCLNHDHGICRGGGFPCYAYRLAHGRLRHVYAPTEGDPFTVKLHMDRLSDVFGKRPRGIFTCDMGDLFGQGMPDPWTQLVMDRMRFNHQHRFYLLTKQPQNLAQFSPFLPNFWVGVTVTRRQFVAPALEALGQVKATVKYLSCEPLLEDIGLTTTALTQAGVTWVIIGGQTGPRKYPEMEWVRDVEAAAHNAGAAVYEKTNMGYTDRLQEVPIGPAAGNG